MSITNHAIGEQINLTGILNQKLESPILQSEMGLDVQASQSGHAVRWDEFSNRFNNDGTFKGITDGDISNSAAIQSSKLAIQQNYKKSSVASPSATANTNGTVVSLTPPTGYKAIYPIAIDVVCSGTFSAQTVTSTITVTYGDATTSSVTKTATALGTTSFSNTDLMSLIKDGTYIKQIDVCSKSTIASSAVVVTFNHCGFYL